MLVKRLIGQIHLWVGIIVGILFFIIALSGAVYTWAPEISRVIYKQAVEPQGAPFVSVSRIKATLDREFPSGDFRTVLYRDRASTVEVLLYGNGTHYNAHLNPYSGELIHLQDMRRGWLNYLKSLHRNLILGQVGRNIVHWVTLLFLVMLTTGLVLWWPVNKVGRKERLTIKWGASPRKLNYDLHNVLGFYATWILIFLVVTGLFWGFEIVKSSLRAVTGENEMVYDEPESEAHDPGASFDQFALLDKLMSDLRKRHPSKHIRISNPHQESEPIRVAVITPDQKLYTTDHYYYDRYTGARITGRFLNGLHEEGSSFHTLHHMIYDIHFGTILGLPGRLLVFFASLIGASLPVTGFIYWWGRRRKSKPKG